MGFKTRRIHRKQPLWRPPLFRCLCGYHGGDFNPCKNSDIGSFHQVRIWNEKYLNHHFVTILLLAFFSKEGYFVVNWGGNGILFFQKGGKPWPWLSNLPFAKAHHTYRSGNPIQPSVIFPPFWMASKPTNMVPSRRQHFTFQGTQQTPDQLKNVLVREASGQAGPNPTKR